MMVAVEGMDGVGKTEVVKHICQKYEFKAIEKPLHYFYNDGAENKYADFMQAVTKIYDVNDNIIKTWYFSLGNLYVARKFQNENIVIDRHLVSNYYWNADTECEKIFKTLIDVSGTPDLTILLYATPKTRMKRLKNRNVNDPDLFDPDKLDDGYNKMIYFMNKFNLPYIVIDTEDKNLGEVNQLVDIEINKLLQNAKCKVKTLEN